MEQSNGFSLIELLLIMALAGSLMSFITISLLHSQHATSISTAGDTLIADIKSQQAKAMNGTNNSAFGIHFASPANNTYVLFQGSSYISGTSTNFTVSSDSTIAYTGSDIIFNQLSGETAGENITVKSTVGSEQEVITVNRYGVVSGIR